MLITEWLDTRINGPRIRWSHLSRRYLPPESQNHDITGSMPLCWLFMPVPPKLSIPEIFTYQQIPQYHQTYSLHYKTGTGAHNNKTEFQKDCFGGREGMEAPTGLIHLFNEPLPWPWSGPSKIPNGSLLGLEDNLRRVKILNMKSMNIKVQVYSSQVTYAENSLKKEAMSSSVSPHLAQC